MRGVLVSFSFALIAGCVMQPQESYRFTSSGYLSGKSPVGYELVKQSVFAPNCVQCHNAQMASGGIKLETYSQVMGNLGMVRSASLVRKTMPPGGPLSGTQAAILNDWIKAGAPESMTPVTPGGGLPTPTPWAGGPIPFARVNSMIFITYCTSCHSGLYPSGGVGLDTYSKVKAALPRFAGSVLGPDAYMPPDAPLSLENQTLLQGWIDQGAPEFDVATPTPRPSPKPSASPSPSPKPSPSPSAATYTYLRSKIIVPRCLSCHSGGGASAGVALDTYTQVYNARNKILSTMQSGSMPKGSSKIPAADITSFQQWINAGAPNN